MEGGSLARVAFEGYSVQLVGAFGWQPLQELFKVGRAAEQQLLRWLESRSCIPGRCSSRPLPQLLPQLAASLPPVPQLKIPLPESARKRTAEFTTTYLSPRLRVARGSTGNVFVFERKE